MASPDDEMYDEQAPDTVADELRRWRYVLTPTLYVDESSDVTDYLWQQVLEQRAIRGWLVVLCAVLIVLVLVLTLPLVI